MFYKWYQGTFYSGQDLTIRKPNEKSFGVNENENDDVDVYNVSSYKFYQYHIVDTH